MKDKIIYELEGVRNQLYGERMSTSDVNEIKHWLNEIRSILDWVEDKELPNV